MPGSHLSTKDSQLLRKPGARIFVRSTSFVLWLRSVIAATGINDSGYKQNEKTSSRKEE